MSREMLGSEDICGWFHSGGHASEKKVVFKCAVHNLEIRHVPECAASTAAMGTCATKYLEHDLSELRHPRRQNAHQTSLKEAVVCYMSSVLFTS